MLRRARLLLAPAVLLFSTACGVEDAPSEKASASTPVPASDSATTEPYDPQLFCNTTEQLEAVGEKVFSSLDRNSTDEEYQAAERTFVLDNADQLDTLVSAAPADLADEMEIFLTAMRQRAGLAGRTVTQREATTAEDEILAFEKQHC